MIKEKTVLILGAGASASFNFPLGSRLVDDILTFIKSSQYSGHRNRVMGVTSTNIDDLNEFHDTLKYSGKVSIDSFLENHDEFMNLGKAIITRVLTRYERKDNIFTSGSESTNWYYYLFDKLGRTISEIEASLSNLNVITFNYDRSLEFLLYHALLNSFKLDAEKCGSMISTFDIIHFYGLLGELHESNSDGRKFQNKLSDVELLKCIEGLNIIREGASSGNEIKKAHDCLEKAKRIIILGFGYYQTNLERLNIKKIIHSKADSLSGSAFGKIKYEGINIIQDSFGLSADHFLRLDNQDGEILPYLRSHTPFDRSWLDRIPGY